MVLGGVSGGFGEAFGRSLEALGVSWAVFSHHFLELLLGMLSGRALGRLLEAPRLDLRWILKGLGGV